MQDATATRLATENGKTKCQEKGRSKGKKCGSTLMIDGKVACKAGHEFTISELIKSTAKPHFYQYWGGVSEWLIARLLEQPDSNELATKLVETFLSPPYTTAKDESTRFWFRGFPDSMPTILEIADIFGLTEHRQALLERIEESCPLPMLERALAKLRHEAEKGDFASGQRYSHLLMDLLKLYRHSISGHKVHGGFRAYLEREALIILNEQDHPEFLFLEDSCREAARFMKKGGNPIFFEETRSDDKGIYEVRFSIPLIIRSANGIRPRWISVRIFTRDNMVEFEGNGSTNVLLAIGEDHKLTDEHVEMLGPYPMIKPNTPLWGKPNGALEIVRVLRTLLRNADLTP